MPYLVGTDEAGYGPNLGPLVVCATVWHVESIEHTDLFARIAGITRPADDDSDAGDLVIGDSKDLYKPGKGLSGLEQGVITCLAAVKKRPRSWKDIWKLVAAEDSACFGELPWYRDFDDRLPVDFPTKEISARTQRFQAACDRAKCQLTQIKSRVVHPSQFNTLVEDYGNKAFALSRTTFELITEIVGGLSSNEPVLVLCDKHGGRNKYGPLLNEFFPDILATVRAEGRARSAYQLGSGKQRREIVFQTKADQSFLPAALASMVAKYLRELSMRAFNDFWTSRVKGLKPTAGYPVDAMRFKKQIRSVQRKLGIDDRILWRCR